MTIWTALVYMFSSSLTLVSVTRLEVEAACAILMEASVAANQTLMEEGAIDAPLAPMGLDLKVAYHASVAAEELWITSVTNRQVNASADQIHMDDSATSANQASGTSRTARGVSATDTRIPAIFEPVTVMIAEITQLVLIVLRVKKDTMETQG